MRLAFLALTGGLIGAVVPVYGLMAAAANDADPTKGGAYVAVAALVAPCGLVVGSLLGIGLHYALPDRNDSER